MYGPSQLGGPGRILACLHNTLALPLPLFSYDLKVPACSCCLLIVSY